MYYHILLATINIITHNYKKLKFYKVFLKKSTLAKVHGCVWIFPWNQMSS
jgi:hypothetical protein